MIGIKNLNQRIRRINNMDNQLILKGKLNNRAACRFDTLVDLIRSMLGPYVEFVSGGFCKCTLRIVGKRYNTQMNLKYELKDMLLGRNYDLVITVPFETDELGPVKDYKIVARHNGGFKRDNISLATEYGNSYAKRFANVLDNKLVKERISRLQLIDLVVEHSNETGVSQIVIKSIKGSCTWTLIPPVFQLIKPKKQDCIDLIELVELIIHGSRLATN